MRLFLPVNASFALLLTSGSIVLLDEFRTSICGQFAEGSQKWHLTQGKEVGQI
jgi:hypothetical protein